MLNGKVAKGIACLALAIASGIPVVSAQDAVPMTAREKELVEKLDTVLQRLEAVESELKDVKSKQQVQGQTLDVNLGTRVAELEKERESSLKTYWKDGLRFDSADGQFKLQLGGRVWADFTWFDQDRDIEDFVSDEDDGGQLRMARLDLRGDIYKDVFYRLEYEFAGNNATPENTSGFTDTYVGLRKIPYVGTLQIGHFKEPMSIEELTSDNFTTFMERSLPNSLVPGRNLGVQLSNAYLGDPGMERLTYALGVFKGTDNWPSLNDGDEDQGYAFTGRVTGLPYFDPANKRLLHLGMSYSHRNPDGAPYVIRSTPEARLLRFRWVDSESAPEGYRLANAIPDNVDLWGIESAFVWGPLSIQGEYVRSNVDSYLGGNLEFDSYYIYASYFLTGESRPYKNASGVFDRVKPLKNFEWGKGWGAWEVAARYSAIDLNDGPIRGGSEDNLTLGINWYLNPNTRWMLNYVMADLDHDLYSGNMNILQTRFQIDF